MKVKRVDYNAVQMYITEDDGEDVAVLYLNVGTPEYKIKKFAATLRKALKEASLKNGK